MAITPQIDHALLAASDKRWLKVAMVVSRAAEALGTALPEGPERYEMVAERLYVLVNGGRLIAEGEVTNWRHSEVRLP